MEFHPPQNSDASAIAYVPLLIQRYAPKSVLDLGCNAGWWLRQFIRHGVTDVQGIDGDNMRKHLLIPSKNFAVHDLTKPLNLNRWFDLVLCLEVAEHLPAAAAPVLIQTIARHTDKVFWSAAVPGQGGWEHVNEQPHEYWIELWYREGFMGQRLIDELPPVTGQNYYRQNAFEFCRIP